MAMADEDRPKAAIGPLVAGKPSTNNIQESNHTAFGKRRGDQSPEV